MTLAAPLCEARNLALLVGIGSYQDPAVTPLEGPPHDVAVLKQVLLERWGFGEDDIQTLVDGEAKHQAILAALDALHERSAPGDQLLFYYSGHGTSRHDPQLGLPVPHGSGALTAWDTVAEGEAKRVMGSLIVGRWDLKPRLERLDQGGRQVLVVIDACYSANSARGFYRSLHSRPSAADLPTRQMLLRLPDKLDLGPHGSGRKPPALPYPYRNIVSLAAASPRERAVDIGRTYLSHFPTLDGQPHGAFTDGLLRILRGQLPADADGDGVLSHVETREAIAHHLAGGGFGHRPQIFPTAADDADGIRYRGLFGRGSTDLPKPHAPALRLRLEPAAEPLREGLGRLVGIELSDQQPDLVLNRQDGDWVLINASGDKLGTAANEARLKARIRQLAWFQRLTWRQGDNPFRLSMEQTEAARGNLNYLGERIAVNLVTERACWPVLLYVDAEGEMAPLYPWRPSEVQPLSPGAPARIPADDSLTVTEPLGTDLVVAACFGERPGFIEDLVGRKQLTPDSELYTAIMDALHAEEGVAIATLEMQTLPPEPRP